MNFNTTRFIARGGEFAYTAPTLELLEIAVERGFGASDDPDSPDYGYDGENGNDNGDY